MTKPNYLNAYEALDAAFEGVKGKTLYKRNIESIDVCSGGSMGFYWGTTFSGKTKFIGQEDKNILLWLGSTTSRESHDSFHSLWYQQVEKIRAHSSAIAQMRYAVEDTKNQKGFAVAKEDMLLEGFRGWKAENTVDNTYCLVELNKLPEEWYSTKGQNSTIPIRTIPNQFELGRIQLNDLAKAGKIPLLLYKPEVVDYIIESINFGDKK